MSSKFKPGDWSDFKGHSLKGMQYCLWLPCHWEVGMLSAFLKNHSFSSDRINIGKKKKKALTYYSLVLYDSNSSFTFYTWILILQPFLLMFQAYVFTISLSVNHTVLLIIHNLSPSQCSACRFSIPIFSPSSYPAWEEIFISQKWNRDGSDTSLGLVHCFFWLMLCNVICPNKNFTLLSCILMSTKLSDICDYLQKATGINMQCL